jgi:hypothetical protein
LALDAGNAVAAARLAIRGLDEVTSATEMTSLLVKFFVAPGGSFTCPRFDLSIPGSPFEEIDVDSNKVLSVGDQLKVNYVTCGNNTLSQGSLTFTFTLLDAVTHGFEGTVEFDSKQLSGDVQIHGTFKMASADALPAIRREQTVTDIAVTIDDHGVVTKLGSARLERTISDQSIYTLDAVGRVESNALNGAYAFASSAPMQGLLGVPPTGGDFVLTAGVAKARVTPTAEVARIDDTADLALDLTGAGQYAPAVQIGWAQLTNGGLFGWLRPNTRPRLTSLSFGPPGATIRDELVVSASATDLDGDQLGYSYAWWRNGVRLSNLGDRLAPGSYVKGDRIEVQVQVYDGNLSDGGNVALTIANAPPRDGVVTITPSAPKSVEDLGMTWSASDPDGDPLQVTIEWQRNGQTIPGRTTTTLPHTEFRKNDRVTAVAHVSDGTDVTLFEASVTILDTPSNVIVPTPPTGVQYGNLVTFNAVAVDPDGDSVTPLRFSIHHGPAGMTVDAVTGLVSWRPAQPMFTTTLDVSYGIAVNEPGSGIATGAMTVTDPNRLWPLMRTGLGYPTYDGLQVGDFDGDGDEETLIFGDIASELDKDPTGTGYRETWAYLLGIDGTNRISAAAHGDVDGDGKQELFFASGKKIIELDGVGRRVTHSVDLPLAGDLMCGDLALGDLNRDGTTELVCFATLLGLRTLNGVEGVLLVLDARTLAIIKQYPAAQYGGGIAVGNVDNDAALEIVTAAGRIYDGNAVFGSGFAAERTYAPGFGLGVRIGDVSGDSAMEIVGFGDEATGSRANVRAYDARPATPTLLWTIINPDVLSLALANLSGDARPEILVGDGSQGGMRFCNITGYNARTTPPSVLFTQATGTTSGAIALAGGDLDHDGQQEFIWASDAGDVLSIHRAATPATLEWPNDPLVARFVAGFGGGEVVHDPAHPTTVMFFARYSDTNGLRLAALDPAAGTLTLGADLGQGSSGNIAMATANYDTDATDEVFLASQLYTNSTDNAVYLSYDFWRNTTEWSSQNLIGETGALGISHGDLNGDGKDDVAVMTAEGVVRVFDVVARSLLWESAPLPFGRDVIIDNLDGAGRPELVVAADERVIVYSANGSSFVQTNSSGQLPGLFDIEVGDTDGDGQHEIFALYRDLSGPGMRIRRFGPNMQQLNDFALPWPAYGLVIERSTAARKNLLMSEAQLFPHLIAVDARNGAEVWRSPALIESVYKDSVHFVDPAGNGNSQIAVATGVGVLLTR